MADAGTWFPFAGDGRVPRPGARRVRFVPGRPKRLHDAGLLPKGSDTWKDLEPGGRIGSMPSRALFERRTPHPASPKLAKGLTKATQPSPTGGEGILVH
jgi:hypothetical protein